MSALEVEIEAEASPRTCAVEGCTRLPRSKVQELCRPHLERFRRQTDPAFLLAERRKWVLKAVARGRRDRRQARLYREAVAAGLLPAEPEARP